MTELQYRSMMADIHAFAELGKHSMLGPEHLMAFSDALIKRGGITSIDDETLAGLLRQCMTFLVEATK